MKTIIVGYDPGLTTGFAAVDLKGNFIKAECRREWAAAAVAQAIREAGQPLILAVDKRQASDSAEKFAARFGCKIWSPDADLGVAEKAEAVKALVAEDMKRRGIKEAPSFSAHERDALAAAIFAYRAFAGQFSKIDDTLGRAGMGAHSDEVKRMVVSGGAKNINEALDKIREKQNAKKAEVKTVRKTQVITQKKSEQLLVGKIKDLERSNDIQKMYIEKLENKTKELERANVRLQEEQLKKTESGRRQLLENKEVSLRESMISNLTANLNELKKANERLRDEIRKRDEGTAISEEGGVPLIPVAEWSREALAEADRNYRAKDGILWVLKFAPSNAAAKYCIALRPRAVAIECDETTERALRNADVAVAKGLRPSMREFYGTAGREELGRALKGGEMAGFLRWLKDYKNSGRAPQ